MKYVKYEQMTGISWNDFISRNDIDFECDDRIIEYFRNDDIVNDCDANTWMTAHIWKMFELSEKDYFLLTLATLIGDLLVTGCIIFQELKNVNYNVDKFEEWFKEHVKYMVFKGKHRHFTPLIMCAGLKLWDEIEKIGGIKKLYEHHHYNFTSIANYLETIPYVGRYSSVIFVQNLNEIVEKKVILDDFFHNPATPFARAFIYLFKLTDIPILKRNVDYKKMWYKHKVKMNTIMNQFSNDLNCESFLTESRMCDWYYFNKSKRTPYVGSHIFEIQDIINKTKISDRYDWNWYESYLKVNNVEKYRTLRWAEIKPKEISLNMKISLL